MTEWPELRDRFREVVGMRRKAGCTVEEVADAIPCHRDTVYAILSGETTNPSKPTRACIEKFVSKASGLRQQADPQPE